MGLTITGFGGGAYTPGRRDLPRRAPRAKPPPDTGAGHDAAQLEQVQAIWLPEQSRAEVAAVNQAIQATETAAEIVMAAKEGLSRISTWLADMRAAAEQALAHATAEVGDAGVPAGGPEKLEQARDSIAGLVESLLFGKQRLLDGGMGCSGMAFGDGLEYVGASDHTRSSSPEGYPVWIRNEATRATALLPVTIPPGVTRPVPWLAIEVDGRRAVHFPAPGEGAEQISKGLNNAAAAQGMEVVAASGPGGQILVRHRRYGSAHGFALLSSAPGLFSLPDGRPRQVNNGLDVSGSINGETAAGAGRILTGCPGNRTTAGLAVRYDGKLPATGGNQPRHESLIRLGIAQEAGEGPEGHLVGRIIVAQQPLVLRMGAGESQTVTIRLNSMHPSRLALGVENECGFRSLAGLRLGNAAEAHNALRLLERAEAEVGEAARHLAELSGSVLAENLSRLRMQAERKREFFSSIAGAGDARALASALRSRMKSQGRLALLAQQQSLPGAMMRLLMGESAPGLSGGVVN
ncbi:MAG: hypothetical protein O7A08_08375 [SAR324 cluster bacterium]|nr:hypothetical protein [SAR324 cluster bacterium]